MKKNNQILLTILIFGLLFIMGWIDNIRGVLLPSIKQGFNVNYTKLATMMLLSSMGYITATFTGGILTDKIGHRNVVLAGFLGVFLGIWVLSAAQSFSIFTIFMMLMGYGTGLLTLAASTIAPIVFLKNQGIMMNLLHFFYGVGATIGPKYAGTMLNLSFTWGKIYRYSLFMILAFFLYFLFCNFPKRKNIEKQDKIPLSIILKDRKVILFSIMLGFYVASEVGIANWLVTYLQKGRNISGIKSASYLSMFYIIFTFGRLVGGFVVEKIGYMKSIQFFIVAAFLSVFTGIMGANQWIIMLSISGIFFSTIYPTTMTLVMRSFDKGINTIIGVVMTSASGINMLTNWLIGWVNDIFGETIGFGLILIYMVIVFIFSVLVKKEITRKNSHIEL